MPTDQELQAIADGAAPAAKVETPAGGQGDTQKQTPAPVSFKDEDIVELTINGEKVQKSYRDVKDGWQRQEDYTRKSQEVANRIKEVKELYDGLTAKQKELVTKEEAIDAVLGRTPRGGNKAVPADDDVVPYGTVKQTVQELLAQEREATTKAQNEQFQAYDQQRTYQRWEEKVGDTVERLTKENPVLTTVPNLIVGLKKMAQQDNPQTEAEMLSAIIKAGKRVASDIDKHFDERQKQADIKRKQLRENGPEPGGKTTAFKAPDKSYVKGRKINWDELEKDVTSYLEDMDE